MCVQGLIGVKPVVIGDLQWGKPVVTGHKAL
jgi:hypothetical protein